MSLFSSTTQFLCMDELSTINCNIADNESPQIAISQHLIHPICAPPKCRCGATTDTHGLHPLSCRLSAGRFSRHSALNDITKHALSSAGFNVFLEPFSLDRGDGERHDGMTAFPFSRGKCLIWDYTSVNSFFPQHWR